SSSDLAPFLQSVDAKDASAGVDIGYLGWAWTTYSCDPNLITDWTSGAPSSMGEAENCELLAIGVAPASNPLFDPATYCPDVTPPPTTSTTSTTTTSTTSTTTTTTTLPPSTTSTSTTTTTTIPACDDPTCHHHHHHHGGGGGY
ncbi:MAG TPA: hypothetical protein VEH29_14105, partial [Acidimicrobiales bacterium]|nr:hypothetical protein [Acidimicrobiales bacterium]